MRFLRTQPCWRCSLFVRCTRRPLGLGCARPAVYVSRRRRSPGAAGWPCSRSNVSRSMTAVVAVRLKDAAGWCDPRSLHRSSKRLLSEGTKTGFDSARQARCLTRPTRPGEGPLRRAFTYRPCPAAACFFRGGESSRVGSRRVHQPVPLFFGRNACRRGRRLKRLRLGVRPWAFD